MYEIYLINMEYLEDYKVKLKFNNNEIRIFDVEQSFPDIAYSNYKNKKIFEKKHNYSIGSYNVEDSILGIFDPNCLYKKSVLLENSIDMLTLINAKMYIDNKIYLQFDNKEYRIFDFQYHLEKTNFKYYKKIKDLNEYYIDCGSLIFGNRHEYKKKYLILSKYLYENSK